MAQILYPESMNKLNLSMDMEEIIDAYNSNRTISGKVFRLNKSEELLEVDLGGGLIGILPFAEATIYPIQKEDGSLSANVYELVGKLIQVKIISVDDNILLSRRLNMISALELIKDETFFKYAEITGFSKQSAFFDVGAGIIGRSYQKEFTDIQFHDIQDIGLKKGEIISVKVLDFLPEDNRFQLSRLEALPSNYDYFTEGDSVTCRVFGEVPEGSGRGYFVLADKTFSGIVDTGNIKLEYGDEIVGYVKKIKDEGLKLSLVKKI